MSSKKMFHLRGLLTSVSSQRTQFKPYGYSLDFSGKDMDGGQILPVFVEVDIPEDMVIESSLDFVAIGLDGLKAILQVTADAVDELNAAYIKKVKGD